VTKPLKSGPKHQGNYHQFHEKSSKWPIWQLIGHLGENSYFVGTVHTDSRIRRNGYFGLTALVTANSRGGAFQHIATATVGVIFLGTPHRGTEASKWGQLIAFTGKQIGLSTEDRILKDLQEDSETLKDLLHEFTLWLFRMSVPTMCFFEQHETDYGKRFGFSWKELVRILEYCYFYSYG
jgi:hypothetical protein